MSVEQKESIMSTELKRCIITDRCCNRNDVSRGSPDIVTIIIIIIFASVLNSQGMKKIRYAIQKSTKIKLE